MKTIKFIIMLLSICLITTLTISCEVEEICPAINCNTGTFIEESCNCVCPTGFSGDNCEIEDFCFTQNMQCFNGGICENGSCDCPDGIIGTYCESFDPAFVQALLDSGRTPLELHFGGITMDQLYGNLYAGGLIFYLNTSDGTGMVAATSDQSTEAEWGCWQTDIPDLMNAGNYAIGPSSEIGAGKVNTDAIIAGCTSNAIAARVCRELGEDWFLPSIKELELMDYNLHLNGYGGFSTYPGHLYWSSTESDLSGAWVLAIDNSTFPNRSVLVKEAPGYVRAVRSF